MKPGNIAWSRYEPVDRRWELADVAGAPTDVRHAYGFFGPTLCGLHQDGVSTSPYPWMPAWVHACRACQDAAAVIDERWPLDKREDRAPMSASNDPEWPPF